MSEEFEFYKNPHDAPAHTETAQRRKPQRASRERRWTLLAAVLLAVLLGVAFLTARGGTGIDIVRRYMATAGLTQNEDGTYGSYTYESDRLARFASLGEGALLRVSSSSISILNGRGYTTYQKETYFESPVIYGNGTAALVYDVGGTTLWWLDREGEVARISCGEILSATINDEGWVAVTEQYSGYKGAVQIYNPQQEKAFLFCSSERFVTDACVLPGGKRFAAVTVGQENGVFTSNVLVYRLDSTEAETSLAISDGFVTHLATVGKHLSFVADTVLTMMDETGERSGSYDYSALYLRGCAFGEEHTALLLARYRSGTLGAVMTLDAEGEVLGAVEMDEEILDISAAGDYVCVLFNGRIEVYTKRMELYASCEIGGMERVFQQQNGSVLAVGDTQAVLVMP